MNRSGSVLLLAMLPVVAGGLGACRPEQPADGLVALRAWNAELEGRWDWARLYHREQRENAPDQPELLLREGLAWLSGYQQSWGEGARLLQLYLDQKEDPETRARLVGIWVALGEVDAAQAAVDGLGESALAAALKAEILHDRDQQASRRWAAAALEEANAAQLDSPTRVRVLLLAAQHAEEDGDLVLAQSRATEAARWAPLNPPAMYQLARLARRQKQAEAATLWLDLHEKLRRLNHDGTMKPLDPPAAVALFRELEGLWPKLGGLTESGSQQIARKKLELLFASGDLNEATTIARSWPKDSRWSSRDLAEAARWAGQAGAITLAAELFAAVLAREPHDVGAISSLALLDLERGELERARERLDQAVATREGADVARFHALIARVAVARDDAAQAERHYQRALELAPWSWVWRQNYSELLLALGRAPEACALCQASLEFPPEADLFWPGLGSCPRPAPAPPQ